MKKVSTYLSLVRILRDRVSYSTVEATTFSSEHWYGAENKVINSYFYQMNGDVSTASWNRDSPLWAHSD